MAIFDVYGELSDAQAITTTAASEDIIDLTLADKEFGVPADKLYLNIVCNTTFAGNSGTLTIALVHDTVAPIDGSSTVRYQTPAFAISSAQLTAGATILSMPLPVDVDEERIIGLYYTVGNGPFTSGKIDAWIGAPMQSAYNAQTASSNVSALS